MGLRERLKFWKWKSWKRLKGWTQKFKKKFKHLFKSHCPSCGSTAPPVEWKVDGKILECASCGRMYSKQEWKPGLIKHAFISAYKASVEKERVVPPIGVAGIAGEVFTVIGLYLLFSLPPGPHLVVLALGLLLLSINVNFFKVLSIFPLLWVTAAVLFGAPVFIPWLYAGPFQFPAWLEEVGLRMLAGQTLKSLVEPYLGALADLLCWSLLFLALHYLYKWAATTPTGPIKMFFSNLLLGALLIAVLMLNWPEIAYASAERWGYYTCVLQNLFNPEVIGVGVSPWEYCKPRKVEKVHKVGEWELVAFKQGVRSLDYKLDMPVRNEEYRFWFTLINRAGKQLRLNELKVLYHNGTQYLEAQSNCAWLQEKLVLSVGETECWAIVPGLDLNKLELKVVANWSQSVSGRDEARVLGSKEYYDRRYAPVCYEHDKKYHCPATTEGPIDLLVAFVPKQYVPELMPRLELVFRVENKGKGYAEFSSAPEPELSKGLEIVDENCLKIPKLTGLKPSDEFTCELRVLERPKYYAEVYAVASLQYSYTRTFSLSLPVYER